MTANLLLISDPLHPRHVDLALSGELDVGTRDVLSHACTLASLVGRRRVRFDLSAVRYLDCASLRLIERTGLDAVADGGAAVLLLPPESGLHQVVEAFDPDAVLPRATTTRVACAVIGCDAGEAGTAGASATVPAAPEQPGPALAARMLRRPLSRRTGPPHLRALAR